MADWVNTLKLRAISIVKIPFIAFLSPVVEELTEEKAVLKIPFGWKTKNQLGSMFFGALTTAADSTFGILYFHLTEKMPKAPLAIIKEFKVNFYKRVEADAYFTCLDGVKIKSLIEAAQNSSERVEDWVEVVATVPSKLGTEPVAKFQILVSARARKS